MSAITFDEFLALCDGVIDLGGDRYQALCPCHNDSNPSLAFRRGDRGAEVIAYCQVCRDEAPFERIVEALRTGTWAADPKERKPIKRRPRGRCVAQHEYRRADGAYAYDKLRYRYTDPETGESSKTLAYRRMPPGCDPGEAVWGRGDERPLLYNLEEVATAEPSRPIYCFEGESDVDEAVRLGFTATCTDGGAWAPGTSPGGKWCDAFETPLHGFERVIICRDNDPDGLEYANHWASRLHGKVGCVKVLTLPGLKEKGDFRDWVAAGGTAEEFIRLANEAPEWKPSTEKPRVWKFNLDEIPRWAPLDFEAIERGGIPPLDYLFKPYIVEGDIFVIAGDATSGKSTLLSRMAYAAASGGEWCGIAVTRKVRVLYIDEEQSSDETYQLFAKHGPYLPRGDLFVFVAQGANLESDEGAAIIEREIAAFRPDLVLIDSATAAFGRTEGNSNSEVGAVYRRLFALRATYSITIGFLHHLGKPGETKRSMMHRILGSVAYTTQASAVWGMVIRDARSAELIGIKRRGVPRPYPSMVIGYLEEEVDGRKRAFLENLGEPVNTESAAKRCELWIRDVLKEAIEPVKRAALLEAGKKVPPPDGPYGQRTIDDELEHMVLMETIERWPKKGHYRLKPRGIFDAEVRP